MAERALDESRRYRAEITPKVAAANKNLGQRIRTRGLEIEYLPEQDLLYVTLGEATPSEAIALNDGTHAVLLLDPETYEITGVEAPFFMEDFRRLEEKPEIWRVVVDMIEKGGNAIYVPAADDAKRAEKAFGGLVPSVT